MTSAGAPAPTVRIYSDFDGTVTKTDIGDALLRHFCGEDLYLRVLDEWQSGSLTAVQCYRKLFAAIPRLTGEMLQDFLSVHEIDPTFPPFAQWCAQRGYPLLILSDGFDAYIEPLLRRAGVTVDFIANRLVPGENTPTVEFPYVDPRCPQLANCKSNHLLLRSRDEDLIVYAGDGSSDFEAAMYADFVFARGELEGWCQEQNISFRRFYSFATVQDALFMMIEQDRLRPRKRARVLRQQLWATG
jgi:2-hydroxy-3-keto-5-methylthiopentenyl-1-phosphate phosphatase